MKGNSPALAVVPPTMSSWLPFSQSGISVGSWGIAAESTTAGMARTVRRSLICILKEAGWKARVGLKLEAKDCWFSDEDWPENGRKTASYLYSTDHSLALRLRFGGIHQPCHIVVVWSRYAQGPKTARTGAIRCSFCM